MKSFYEQNSACDRVAWKVNSCFRVSSFLRQKCEMLLYMTAQRLHKRSGNKGVQKDAGEKTQDD